MPPVIPSNVPWEVLEIINPEKLFDMEIEILDSKFFSSSSGDNFRKIGTLLKLFFSNSLALVFICEVKSSMKSEDESFLRPSVLGEEILTAT